MLNDYEVIIGLEVHAQLLTESELESVVESVVQDNPDKEEKYKAGKKTFRFLYGAGDEMYKV